MAKKTTKGLSAVGRFERPKSIHPLDQALSPFCDLVRQNARHVLSPLTVPRQDPLLRITGNDVTYSGDDRELVIACPLDGISGSVAYKERQPEHLGKIKLERDSNCGLVVEHFRPWRCIEAKKIGGVWSASTPRVEHRHCATFDIINIYNAICSAACKQGQEYKDYSIFQTDVDWGDVAQDVDTFEMDIEQLVSNCHLLREALQAIKAFLKSQDERLVRMERELLHAVAASKHFNCAADQMYLTRDLSFEEQAKRDECDFDREEIRLSLRDLLYNHLNFVESHRVSESDMRLLSADLTGSASTALALPADTSGNVEEFVIAKMGLALTLVAQTTELRTDITLPSAGWRVLNW